RRRFAAPQLPLGFAALRAGGGCEGGPGRYRTRGERGDRARLGLRRRFRRRRWLRRDRRLRRRRYVRRGAGLAHFATDLFVDVVGRLVDVGRQGGDVSVWFFGLVERVQDIDIDEMRELPAARRRQMDAVRAAQLYL